MATKGRMFRVDDALYEAAQKRAAVENTNVTQVVVEALERFVNPVSDATLAAWVDAACAFFGRPAVAAALGVPRYRVDKYRRGDIPEQDATPIRRRLETLSRKGTGKK